MQKAWSRVLYYLLRYRRWPIGVILSGGVALSILAAFLIQTWELSSRQVRFQQRIGNLTTSLARNMDRYIEVLHSLQDFYHSTPRSITRSEFQSFTQRSVSSYPGIQALEWAPQIKHRERAQFEALIRRTIDPNFQIQEQASQGTLEVAQIRSEYVPVLYIQPFQKNEVALGFDLASDRKRRLALEKARDRGGIATTNRIRLVQERKDQFSFLVFLPVYRTQRVPPTVLERRSVLVGYVLGVFRVSDVIEESLKGIITEIDFTLTDVTANAEEQFLGTYQSINRTVSTDPDRFHDAKSALCAQVELCSRPLIVGDREWRIQFQPGANYLENQFSLLSLLTLLVGLLLTAILTIYLNQALLELERTKQMSELKLQFFSMASHEFRTPLSTVLLSVQSLLANYEELTDAQKVGNLRRIEMNARRMSQQLSDLLTLTRAEAGKLDFAPEITHLEQFCLRIIDELQGREANRILFTASGACKAYVDQKLLYSILMNLLSNAIKYSKPEQTIEFSLICDAETAIFRISDQGIGIPTEEMTRVTDRFYRGSNAGQVEGLGLGLTIVKICLAAHGGQLKIESALGKGTTFIIHLPMNTHL